MVNEGEADGNAQPTNVAGETGKGKEEAKGDEKEIISVSSVDELLEPTVERESWGSKVSYILTLVGYSVGFGNIWRFPYLLQENGGVVFLIPYFVSVFCLGIPVFYLELAVGQRLRKGPVASWHEVSPYLGGMGATTAVLCLLFALYYNTLVAWVFSYLFDTFRSTLLYTNCKTAVDGECDVSLANRSEECDICNRSGSSQYYWNRRVLGISGSIDDPGRWNWWLFMCLVCSWTLVYGILVKGIKSAGKAVYFTALLPYVILLIFLIRGLMLPNMSNGYKVLFTPRWEKLSEPVVWKTAASQIFFSLGIGFGCLVAFASYLKPNNDCHQDAIIIAVVNCATSLFATFTIFPYLGYKGTEAFASCKTERRSRLLAAFGFETSDDVDFPDAGGIVYYTFNGIDYDLTIPADLDLSQIRDCTLRTSIEASASGTGLVFIVFAQAIATLQPPQLWAFLFFTMLLTLGVDSTFGTLEGALAAMVDLQLKTKKWVITGVACLFLFCLAFMFSWGWGQYILTFMDDYTGNWPLLLIGLAECLGISWVYGLQRFGRDLQLMTGKRPGLYWLICWKYISPLLVIFIFVFTLLDLARHGVTYRVWNHTGAKFETVAYPTYAVILGFSLTAMIIMWIPLIAILRRYGINVIKDEASADFPEEELKKARNYREEDEIPKDSVTKLVLWGNLQKSSTDTRSGEVISTEEPSPTT